MVAKSGFFIQIDGIEGSATDSAHTKWIDVLEFSHGAEQNISSSRAGDVSGRGILTPFVFSHLVDKATPKLQQTCLQGKLISKATFAYSQIIAGTAVTVYEIVLEGLRIAKAEVESTEIEQGLPQRPVETVSMIANKITWKVTPIKTDGTKDGAIEASFDVVGNL